MKSKTSKRSLFFFSVIFGALILGCYGHNRGSFSKSVEHVAMNRGAGSSSASSATPYEKYGGPEAVKKIVDDTWYLLLADPELEPVFSLVGKAKGESLDRVKSCLDLQMSVLLDGPGEIPGISRTRHAPESGYRCQEISQIFSELGVSAEEFDKFTLHLMTVLRSHGFSSEDITVVTKSFLSSSPAVATIF